MVSEALAVESIEQLLRQCREVFGPGWSRPAGAEVHRRVELLSDTAEAEGQRALAEASLELSVFLCSLVEADSAPGDVVQARLAAICDRVQAAVRPGVLQPAAARDRVRRAPLLIMLTDAAEPRLELAAELGRLQFLVDRAETLDSLATLLDRRSAELIIVAPTWLDQIGEVLRVVARSSHNRLIEPGTVVLASDDDRAKRLFALRAGVDSVLDDDHPEPLAQALAECARTRRRAAFRVLVVEDDRAQAMFVQSVLGYRGIECELAQSAAEALHACREFAPDLILLDLHLPDRNGIELAQMLRERPGFDLVQIVFLSGESDMEEQFRAIRLGADDWISKPVRPRHLLAAIESRAARAQRIRHRGDADLATRTAHGLLSRRQLLAAVQRAQREVAASPAVLFGLQTVYPVGVEARVDFVQQEELDGEIVRAILAEHLVDGVCQVDHGRVLALLDERRAERGTLEGLQAALARRRWLSHEHPLALEFVAAAIELGPENGAAEAAVQHCLDHLQSPPAQASPLHWQPLRRGVAEQPPGWAELIAACAEDQLSAHARLGFHPMLPVRGRLSGQFAVSLRFVYGSPAIELERTSYQDCLRTHQLGERIDQWLLAECIRRLREAADAGRDLGLAVPVGEQSLAGVHLAPWLRAELKRCRLQSPNLSLWVNVDGVRQSVARTQRLLAPLADTGVRIAIGPLGETPADLELARLNEVHALVCRTEAVKAGPTLLPDQLLKVAADYGKTVIVESVHELANLTEVFNTSAHYVVGKAVAPRLPQPEFEFPAM